MEDTCVRTNFRDEAIYEYSSPELPVNLSRQVGVWIEVFFNNGNRQLRITENNNVMVYDLVPPKKPEETPIPLFRDRSNDLQVAPGKPVVLTISVA